MKHSDTCVCQVSHQIFCAKQIGVCRLSTQWTVIPFPYLSPCQLPSHIPSVLLAHHVLPQYSHWRWRHLRQLCWLAALSLQRLPPCQATVGWTYKSRLQLMDEWFLKLSCSPVLQVISSPGRWTDGRKLARSPVSNIFYFLLIVHIIFFYLFSGTASISTYCQLPEIITCKSINYNLRTTN